MGKIGKISFNPNSQKVKSTFFSKELIYDYLSKQLNVEKKELLENAMNENFSVRLEVKRVQAAQNFLVTLRNFSLPSQLSQKIDVPEVQNFMSKNSFDLKALPEGLKQAMLALGVVSILVIVATIIPWHKIRDVQFLSPSHNVLVVEVNKKENLQNLSEMEKNEPPLFADDQVAIAMNQDSKGTNPTVPEIKGATQDSKAAESNSQSKELKDSSGAIAKNQELKAKERETVPVKTAPSEASSTNVTTAQDPTSEAPVTTGFLYRGQMKLTNLVVNGKRLTEKIIEIGGRKAGEVDLGWNRGPQTLYYHFTIPEARYPELMTFLELYGKPSISKEKHPRVMPEGIIRLILTVDEEKQ